MYKRESDRKSQARRLHEVSNRLSDGAHLQRGEEGLQLKEYRLLQLARLAAVLGLDACQQKGGKVR